MKKKPRLRKKLLRVSIAIIMLFTATIFFVTDNRVNNLIEDNMFEKLDSISAFGLDVIESKHDGDWNVKDGRLFKGENLVSYNFGIVDEVKKKINALATIYLKDEIVTTNILDSEGERVVGEKVSGEIAKKVLENGSVYRGVENILGEKHIVKYIPIKNSEDRIIGMWSVAIPKTYVGDQAKQILTMRASIVVVSLLCGILGCIILLLYSKKYLSDIDTLKVSFIESDSSGDRTQRKVLTMSLLLTVTFFLIWFVIQGFTVGNVVNTLENDNIQDKLTVNSELGYMLIDEIYEGDWSIESSMLYKGHAYMYENYDIVDRISSSTNSFLTVFMGDTIVSTNILKADGTRPIGAKASNKVIENVLKKGNEYISETSIAGKKYITKYTPIKDSEGKIIGMWANGIEKKVAASHIAGIRKRITQISLLAIIIAFITFLRLSIKMASDIRNFDVSLQTSIN
ncbi:MAG: histidine kinase [Clostridium sp.]|nr:histidine kinase [Clostridium sp.]